MPAARERLDLTAASAHGLRAETPPSTSRCPDECACVWARNGRVTWSRFGGASVVSRHYLVRPKVNVRP